MHEINTWEGCRNLLCIRADNMGDLIMTGPALRSLKKRFGCRITVLTSAMGRLATPFLPVIDDVMVSDLPWVRNNTDANENDLQLLIHQVRQKKFDGVIIFTVYTQSSLPAALLALLAGIPRRLAYSRENPYNLLTHWLPDKEPYRHITHQVTRDLQLVASIGAVTNEEQLFLEVGEPEYDSMLLKLKKAGLDLATPFFLFHPGVSEDKRQYPSSYWIEAGAALVAEKGHPVIVTGTAGERPLTRMIAEGIGPHAIDMGGALTIGEFIAAVDKAMLVVSVNTSTIHIAAARQTPVVVLYANTNPQHTPWNARSRVLPFSVPEALVSKNEIITWVSNQIYRDFVPFPEPATVVEAILELLSAEETNRHEHC